MAKNPYKEIGGVIRKAVYPRACDVVVWLTLDGEEIVTLYRFDSEDCVWYWTSDWWEGEAEVKLISWCLFEDLKPVTHAHWTYEIDDLFPADSMMICSNCGEYERLGANDNYCGNCGAKMDEEVGK